MAVVKSLAFCNKSKLKNLMSFVNSEFSKQEFAPFPLDIINYFLPYRMKFLRESFVALSCDKITGLITLEKDDGNKNRLKITQLFLEHDSTEYGELLIDFVVAKFLAQGAHSFYVAVDEGNNRMLKLLSDACKFRLVARENLYMIKKSDLNIRYDSDVGCIRKMYSSDIADMVGFYNNCLNSHQKQSFVKEKSRLRGNFASQIKGVPLQQFILRNNKNQIFGYFKISALNNYDYALDTVLMPSYEGYYMDILNFSFGEISKRSLDWNLFVKLKSCFLNFEKLNQTMELNGYICKKRNNILTKDLYRPVKADNTVYGKQIIFSDITPFPTS